MTKWPRLQKACAIPHINYEGVLSSVAQHVDRSPPILDPLLAVLCNLSGFNAAIGCKPRHLCWSHREAGLGDAVFLAAKERYVGLSTSAFQKIVMIPFKFNGIMTTFRKAEVDTPSYLVLCEDEFDSVSDQNSN